MEMKKEITLGSLLGILVPIFVLILGWGISINSRLSEKDIVDANQNKQINKNDAKIEKVDDARQQDNKDIQLKLDRIIENQNKEK
tara:strand:+ start:614 stop:868 length:255 start_codon:yes stop_codon:yes gene_type:complete